MAQPFFRGNYGSALGRVDTRPIIEAGRAQGQMYAQAGAQIGNMIQQYGLNKQKREEMTNEIESAIKMNPGIVERLTGTGDEAFDKKQQTAIEKLTSGDLNMTGLKGLAGDIARLEKQDLKEAEASRQKLMDALQISKLQTEDQNRKIAKENQAFKTLEKQRTEKYYETVENKLNDLTVAVGSGKKSFDELGHYDKFVLGNAAGIRNRAIPKEELFYDPSADLDNAKAKLEFESLKRQEKDAKVESDRLPEFATKEEALSFAETLPEGVSAKISSDKDGFKADLAVSEKARMEDVATIPGYDNYFQLGGYIYEGDPSKKKLTKVGSQNFGQDIELLMKVIEAMETPSLVEYENVKSRSTRDGDNYLFVNPQTQEEVEYPYNESQENKLRELNALRNQLSIRGQNVLDLRTTR
jgi:hypothetical protein